MAKQKVKSAAEQMLNEVRQVIGRYAEKLSERELYEELLVEADGWQMRLDEINRDGEDE